MGKTASSLLFGRRRRGPGPSATPRSASPLVVDEKIADLLGRLPLEHFNEQGMSEVCCFTNNGPIGLYAEPEWAPSVDDYLIRADVIALQALIGRQTGANSFISIKPERRTLSVWRDQDAYEDGHQPLAAVTLLKEQS